MGGVETEVLGRVEVVVLVHWALRVGSGVWLLGWV